MRLTFTKMQGLGNDFVVFDGVRQHVDLKPEQLRLLADRHFGVGCDQILLVERPGRPDCDFRYRIFNADGGEVQQCGNGARCFARFVHDQGLTDKREIRVETASGIIVPRLEADGQVTVDMGPPRFEPAEIPFVADARAVTYVLDDLPDGPVELVALSMGNPHAVLETCNVDTAPVAEWGPLIEHHPRFPERVNVGFMQLLHSRAIRLRVFERGSGETLACGTGACAAAVAGMVRGLLEREVEVQTRGGRLTIRWDGEGHPVLMTGPAVSVFEGEIEI
ncbi:MAG: diaminopimelate epimerase [Gallionellaceae bacterium]|nr:diaminopimelate epimerase [Gallionellaceae bacterium]